MRRRIGMILAWVGLTWVGIAASVHAAEPAACASIEDPTARLACYDAASGRANATPPPVATATPSPATVPAPATAVAPTVPAAGAAVAGAAVAGSTAATATPRPTGEQAFGLPPERLIAKDESSVEQIRARVATVGRQPTPGRWVVTLDNGQVWEQRETARPQATNPRPGDEVTIRTAALGSFLLTAPGRGTFRVRRVK